MDTKKFKIKIMEKDKRLDEVADYIECNIATLYRKMNGYSDFTCAEVKKIASFLNLSQAEVNTIFFN